MGMFGKIIIGFFIGLLCGVVPLLYGLLNGNKLYAFIGMAASAVTGVLFSVFEKSPFSAIVVAVLVVLVMIAQKKRKQQEEDSDAEDQDEIE